MSSRIADRVAETTSVTGTGTAMLLGATDNHQQFSSAFADQAQVYYCIAGAGDWEVGRGTYVLATNSITRDVIQDSSNSGAAVVFTAGAKNIFCTATAAAINSHRELIILYRLGL